MTEPWADPTRPASSYPIRYEVEAGDRLGAIMAAGERLRTGVVVTELRSAEPWSGVPGWWVVLMDVTEGDPLWPGDLPVDEPDPVTLAKWDADR